MAGGAPARWKIVAVKIPKDITREDRQLAEGKELLDVEPHENIVQIFDMGRIDNEWFYIEMEYFLPNPGAKA